MLDAVHQVTERLRKRPQARRVLLLISEYRAIAAANMILNRQ